MNVSDFVTEADDAPVLCCLVDGLCYIGIQSSPLLEDVIECELADFGSHRRLGELRNRILGILNTVAEKMALVTISTKQSIIHT